MTGGAAPELSALEIACGIVLDPAPKPRPLPPPAASPRRALQDAVLPALLRPPCLVSFSGGRDSSLVLAAAVDVARREGLAAPIPITNRFPAAPRTDETRWQEQVIAHLGLSDWQRLEFDDELDAVGPYAQRLLRAHGLLWPCNVHFHAPLLDAARGGSLLTGLGGDELLDAVRPPPRRTRPRAVAHATLARAPARLRAAVIARRHPLEYPWLAPHARRAATRALAAEQAALPRKLDARMGVALAARYLRVARASLALCAAAGDVLIDHPLCDPGLWSALAREAAARGGHLEDGDEPLGGLFADWLPAALASRPDKATFNAVFFNRHSRALAREWDGAGAPAALVDVGALRAHWRTQDPVIQSLTLLQAAWLADAAT